MLDDLNDLYYFANVVEHGGFAAAGRALRQPKSKLSRRVGQLEESLGIRLIERSTRRFRVTDVGVAFYERCKAILNDIDQARAVAAEARSEPRGVVRCSCPTGLVEEVMRPVPELLLHHPGLRLQLVAVDRPVALIDERVDVAIRVRVSFDSDAELTVRSLHRARKILVAAPTWARRIGTATDVRVLSTISTLASTDDQNEVTWELVHEDGTRCRVQHKPRFACTDFTALRAAAVAELGVSFLPEGSCAAALASGALVHVLPAWSGDDAIVHLVFTTRRGLPPAVRALIDHLVSRMGEPPSLKPVEPERHPPRGRPAQSRRLRTREPT
jgi:DNA-binding transcriptional LysR family regulator